LLAALIIKVPGWFGFPLVDHEDAYGRNLSFMVLPVLTGYFVWKRGLNVTTCVWLLLAFLAAGLFANVYPFARHSDTEELTMLHLPIALWLVVGIAYVGGHWFSENGRMNFVRFSGELFIY